MGERPSYDEYFMEMAHVVKKRSTCIRRSVGAILVKDKHILSTGYNGAPKGHKHCSEVGCLRELRNVPSGERHEICRGLHAEQNAIIQAAVFGISIVDSVLYCTNTYVFNRNKNQFFSSFYSSYTSYLCYAPY